MKMERMLIQIPKALKVKLDALRAQGYTASGFIRHLLEKELQTPGDTEADVRRPARRRR